MKFFVAALFALALLTFPETALNAALSAMYAWYLSVAPALFPFMALMPALTCPDSARVWERLLGKLMRPVLNLPGSAAPAVAIGMTAGSPAGALAAVRICASAGLSRAELERLLWCVCGMSPAFLVTGLGAAMLGSPSDGRILLRAQIFSQLAMLLLTRSVQPDQPLSPREASEAPESVRAAVLNVLTVCGYMTFFAIVAALIARILRSETAGLAALCLLDTPSGARALANLPITRETRLLLLAAMNGLGGLCIAAQNLASCKKLGVRTGKYALSRLSHAFLTTAATALQLRWNTQTGQNALPPLEISALIAAFLTLPALISWKKDPFLNKRNFEKNAEFPPENHQKPQLMVFHASDKPQHMVK